MDGWITFWTVVLIVALAMYFGVALLAAVLGAANLRDLVAGRTRADDDPMADAGERGASAP